MSTTNSDASATKQSAQAQNVVKPKQDASPTAKLKYPFWFGGSAASMAAVVTHPLDLGTTPSLPQLSCVTDHCGSEGTTPDENS